MKKIINEFGTSYAPDCVDEYLYDIWAIGYDYDGCNTVESLKELIDELVSYAAKARECLWEGELFGAFGKPEKKEYCVAGEVERFRCPHCKEWMTIDDAIY